MSFASKLQEIRQNNEISQEKLAEILNVSRQSVSKWERGKGYPEIDKLIFISNYFNIPLDELLKDNTSHKVTRQPINLIKPEDKEKYPVKEVYPIPKVNVSENNNGLLKYSNYTVNSVKSQKIPSGNKKKNKYKLRQKLLIITMSSLGAFFISFAVAFNLSHEQQYGTGDVVVSYAEEKYYDEYDCSQYNIKYYTGKISPSETAYFIIDADNGNGIVRRLESTEYENYIKLTPLNENDEAIYCYKDWIDSGDVKILNSTGNIIIIVPEYLTRSNILAEEASDFILMEDEFGYKYFIPKEFIFNEINDIRE